MGIRWYDQALYEKVKNWVKDPNMRILKPDETSRLFQLTLDEKSDKPITLPLIALSRDNNVEIVSTSQKPLTYDGGHISANNEQSKILNGIPIKITYQLDIYTKFFDEADEYIRNFVFNIINYPKVSIEIPYNNSKIVHDSTLLVESNISDNSDIKERLISGRFTRLSLKLTIDDAYLFSVPFMSNWSINGDYIYNHVETSGQEE